MLHLTLPCKQKFVNVNLENLHAFFMHVKHFLLYITACACNMFTFKVERTLLKLKKNKKNNVKLASLSFVNMAITFVGI